MGTRQASISGKKSEKKRGKNYKMELKNSKKLSLIRLDKHKAKLTIWVKSFFTSILFLLISYANGQNTNNYWEKWDSRYPEVDIISILQYERYYADSVENNSEIPQWYLRKATYRFEAEYLEKTRKTNKEVMTSMKNVFKLFIGNPKQLKGMINNEVLFRVGEEEIWMPIQPQILRALKEEAKVGDVITLYCLFLNEHTDKKVLYNTFFISEFINYNY
jgi:hypothetical protein